MTNDAPHSAPTPLSRFLGGWMRHASPQEPEQVVDDAEATETVEAAEATEAAESAVSPEAASIDGPAVSAEVASPDAQGEPDAAPTAPGDSSTGDETLVGQVASERPQTPEESSDLADSTNPDDLEGAEETVEEEHVIEVADPRDFADDSGPQYEDEDFDDIVDGEAAPPPPPRPPPPAPPGRPRPPVVRPRTG